MDKNLCETLVKKNIICKGTKLLATIKKIGIGGAITKKPTNLVVEDIEGSIRLDWPIDLIFTCLDLDTKQQVDIVHSQILSVDGMVPDRLGKIFNINPDGTLRAQGKKRGRKSKK